MHDGRGGPGREARLERADVRGECVDGRFGVPELGRRFLDRAAAWVRMGGREGVHKGAPEGNTYGQRLSVYLFI